MQRQQRNSCLNKSSTGRPTNDAINAGGLCHCILCVLLKTAATTANPHNAPSSDQKAPRTFPTSCCFDFLYPKNLETCGGSLCNGEGGMTRFRYRSKSRSQARLLSRNPIIKRQSTGGPGSTSPRNKKYLCRNRDGPSFYTRTPPAPS